MSGIIEKAKEVLGGHEKKRDTQHSSSNAGPHNSNAANKLDPRVDSDQDHRAKGNAFSSNAGPHDSNAANKLDPRVDSDQDHRADPNSVVGGYKPGQAEGPFGHSNHGPLGTSGTHSTQGTLGGTHSTHGTAGTGGIHSNHGAFETGAAPHTAGPHDKDLLNKVDPRVDSDRDGSTTIGGNATNPRI
ncbi:hypothetical protein H2200_004481 [Cladophialophora chaetospira]|uniref:Cell surface protein n=1 Tax=Cladophialophora chaetospira TaxID=386627 RepID=A0AA39CJI7_9EURO|nr:hypothetical protein H2200_004481 [Cladophialophora chaetospira]